MNQGVTQETDFPWKLTGKTKYIHDLHLPGELIGGIVRSPHAHARIGRVDVSRARAMAGVHAVITGADVPQGAYGPTAFKDWNILATDRVLFVGDEVVAVAAVDAETLARALESIEVEYELLDAVLTPQAAMEPGAPVVHSETPSNRPVHISLQRGDVDVAFAAAAIVRGGQFSTNRIYQGHLEPIGVLASWTDEDGLTLWASSHIPYRARETYAAAFGLSEDQVRIIVPPIGGSFGSKYVLKAHVIAAALTIAARLPIRMIFDRYEDMISAHPRVPLTMDVRIAADANGRFVGKDVVVYGDAGARIYWSPNVMATACTRPDGLYNFENVRAEGHLCYTNQSATTCMRGFGNAEMLFAVESVIDEIALGLELDPAQVRLRNVVHQGETTIHGYQLDTCEVEASLRRVLEMSDWSRRDGLPPQRGLGLALGNHVSGYRGIDPRFEGSTAVLRLRDDGRVEVETGEIDLGQGLNTAYAGIAARVLDIDVARVEVKSGDTSRFPYGIGTLASRSTVMGGSAVQMAAEQLRDKLADFAESQPESFPSLGALAVAYRRANAGDEPTTRATYAPDTQFPDQTYYGNPSPSYPFAAHVAEVEVDQETGRVRVIGYWAVHDAGVVLNRVTAVGQVVGGIAQGVGWATMENFIVHAGEVRNPSLMDYRMPGAADMPPVEVDFVESPDPHGPFGAKSVAEVAIDPVAAAIANAIAHATGRRGYDLPLSPERVWRLLQAADLEV